MGRIPMASTPSLRQLRSRHKCSVRRTSSALGEGVGQSDDADIIEALQYPGPVDN